MNNLNISFLVSALLLASIFLCGVFLNLNIKDSKEELYDLQKEIKQIKLDMKRQRIEITSLTNPLYVINYIEKRAYKPVKLRNIKVLNIIE